MKILCIINNGFEESETICPIDILKRANHNVTIASNTSFATGSHGITFSNLELLSNINFNDYDLLLLPGGPHWKENQNNKLYLEAINAFKNKAIAAICASPTILGKLGLLKGKKYTCFPPMNEDFGGTFTGEESVIDSNIITGRSAGSSLEFGYKIIEYLDGTSAVNKVKESMFY
ncbi:MAG: DJ-1/PfpI family protein [Anaeroplasmataceae bacterium]